MKVFVTSCVGWEIHFVLQKRKSNLLVAHSIMPLLGKLWVSSEVIWEVEGYPAYRESNHLHFLMVLGFTPEQVWDEAIHKTTTNAWIL